MKVSTNSVPAFTPVTVSITFESKDELDVFVEMLDYNISIPELVFKKNEQVPNRTVLENIMTKIHGVIRII